MVDSPTVATTRRAGERATRAKVYKENRKKNRIECYRIFLYGSATRYGRVPGRYFSSFLNVYYITIFTGTTSTRTRHADTNIFTIFFIFEQFLQVY